VYHVSVCCAECDLWTSEVDAIPAPFSLAFHVFLKLILVSYSYEDVVFNRYVEIKIIY
jgi:hypothetical protein